MPSTAVPTSPTGTSASVARTRPSATATPAVPHVVQATDGTWRQIGITSFTMLTPDASGRRLGLHQELRGGRAGRADRRLDRQHRQGPQRRRRCRRYGCGSRLGDFVAPSLTLKAQRARARRAFRVTYTVIDNSRVTAETVVIKKGSRVVARGATAFGPGFGPAYSLRVKGLARGTYTILLVSRDRAGNSTRLRQAPRPDRPAHRPVARAPTPPEWLGRHGSRNRSAFPAPGGPSRTVGTYSTSCNRPSNVRLAIISSATSGYPS